MKNRFLWFAAASFMLAACSDDSSTQAKGAPDSGEDSPVAEVNRDSSATEPEGDVTGTDLTATEGKGFFKGSSCQADESLFENAFAGKALKKTASEEKYSEGGLERSFYVEDAGNSVQVFVTGFVSACNKVIRGVDVYVQGDTLFATVNYRPDTETLCLCSWVDMSFTVDKALLDDSVKTLVMGEEVFTLREEEPAVADSAVTEPVEPQD